MPGYPIRTPWDQRSVDNSPRPIAASHVLHRLLVPRHPPFALHNLTTKMLASTMHISNNNQTPTTTPPHTPTSNPNPRPESPDPKTQTRKPRNSCIKRQFGGPVGPGARNNNPEKLVQLPEPAPGRPSGQS